MERNRIQAIDNMMILHSYIMGLLNSVVFYLLWKDTRRGDNTTWLVRKNDVVTANFLLCVNLVVKTWEIIMLFISCVK